MGSGHAWGWRLKGAVVRRTDDDTEIIRTDRSPYFRRIRRRQRSRGLLAMASLVAMVLAAVEFGWRPASRSGLTQVRLDVRAEPVSAAFELDGELVARGHLLRRLPADGRSHHLRVFAPGFVAQHFEFTDEPPPRVVQLLPAAASEQPDERLRTKTTTREARRIEDGETERAVVEGPPASDDTAADPADAADDSDGMDAEAAPSVLGRREQAGGDGVGTPRREAASRPPKAHRRRPRRRRVTANRSPILQ